MTGEVSQPSDLIASDKVEGATVYGADREQIGTIRRMMINKQSGEVVYAVLSFGGVLGIGDEQYPLPWSALRYDRSLGGYVTKLTQAQLRDAPKHLASEDWDWNDRGRSDALDAYYRPAQSGV